MREANTGSNLIFIACQPRSGSTLLQRMLGSHPEIHTVSEPWIMLHPIYALRERGIEAEYDATLARAALDSFLDELAKGSKDYLEGIRRMYGHLYQKALRGKDAHLFLDKTPRYYFILRELQRVFPEARFILLFRHPLAVLSSIFRTWIEDDLLKIAQYQEDLLRAPHLLLEGQAELGNAALSVKYEDLVQDAKGEMQRVCDHLCIPFEPEILRYGKHDMSEWRFGDPEKVYQHARPQTSSLQKWAQTKDAQ